LAPLTRPGGAPESIHMLLAALMCTGGVVASIYAIGMLRGRRDAYHCADSASARHGARVRTAAVVIGDWAARVVEARQPAKFAALEGIGHTTSHAPLTLAESTTRSPAESSVDYAPGRTHLLSHFRPSATIRA